MALRGRYAPSPSGRMHIGNLFAALLAWLDARARGGVFLLRIEDLDPVRTSLEHARVLADDLRWLGLDWDEGFEMGGEMGPYCQSERTERYEAAFRLLYGRGLVYPCFCSRADRLAAAAPHPGEEQACPKPCPCKALSARAREALALVRSPAWKVAVPEETVAFTDGVYGPFAQNLARECGDFIIRRADGVFGYQLAVTVDDGAMEIGSVVRGRDLLDSSPRQIWLLRELGYPPPGYLHVPLLTAPDGRRLSKREEDLDAGSLRLRFTPEKLAGRLAFWAGIRPDGGAIPAKELVGAYSANKIRKEDIVINYTSSFNNL